MLTRYNPFNLSTIFDDDFSSVFKYMPRTWSPPVDIYEEKDHTVIEVEAPGMSPDDVKVSVDRNILTISGEKKVEKKGKEYQRVERYIGKFLRSFTLSSTINTEAINASYNNGVLKITIPKKEEIKPKQIEIKTK